MKIILSRHGNTFASGETTRWLGAGQDFPLVDSGIEQAKNLVRVIQQAGIDLKAIYCGPLRRTNDYASIIAKELCSALQPIIDLRLNELDYGHWSGLSNLEIQQKNDTSELAAWENFSQWPKKAGWSGFPELIFREIHEFAGDLIKKHAPTDRILVISSNGRLRYFLQLIPGAFKWHVKNKNFKVATGHLCLFTYENKRRQVDFWNKKPELLLNNTDFLQTC